MAEPVFASPVTRSYDTDREGELTLSDRSMLAKMVVRAAAGTAAEADLATAFGSSRIEGSGEDGVIIAGTRPDEWMLLGPRPLALDFGTAIIKKDQDEEQLVSFTLGRSF